MGEPPDNAGRRAPIDGRASDRRHAAWALAIVVPAPSIGALCSFWLLPGPIGMVVYALGKLVLYGTPALWHRFVDRRVWSFSAGDASKRRWAWAIGGASGVLIGLAILGGRLVMGEGAVDTESLRAVLAKNSIATPLAFLMAAAWFSLGNALLEEYAFRWFITTRFEAIAPKRAAVLSAAAFTLHHVIVLAAYLPVGATALASTGVFVGGLFWSWLYRRSRSVWPGWLSHALVDIAIMAIGYASLF